MFGFTSKKRLRSAQVDLAINQIDTLRILHAYKDLQAQWNELIDLINSKGGQHFLDNATLSGPGEFNKAELRYILQRCHIDKNRDNELAPEITRKLIELLKTAEEES